MADCKANFGQKSLIFLMTDRLTVTDGWWLVVPRGSGGCVYSREDAEGDVVVETRLILLA